MPLDLNELKQTLASGLLSFPITDFDAQGNFNEASYRKRLEWLMPYGATGLFAAGGTGEFFSLGKDEYSQIIKTAVDTCKGKVPVLAGTGYSTRMAIEFAQEAERRGADGILILPHYLTEADQEGVRQHVTAICKSVKIGCIIYNRNVCRLNGAQVERIADECPNLVGFKDGIGDVDLLMSVRSRLGDRLMYLGGMPTAEIYAVAALAIGMSTYSSAVFNFVPQLAMDYYNAVRANDQATIDRLLKSFFFPYLEIRNRRHGYAVSIVKAGCRVVGKDGGPVRLPLTDLNPQEQDDLRALIERNGIKVNKVA
jgi:5-dehydro-4-deoxyglucarate dehydratase